MIRARSGKNAGRLLLGAGVLAMLIPAIAGCEAGEGAPTLQFHPAAAGAQADVNGIKITNAFVLGTPSGGAVPSGSSASLFVSLYNGGDSADTLESATATGTAENITLSKGTVDLPANSAPVNLTGPTPQVVLENLTKPLDGGSTIPVTFNFQHAGTVTLEVPVEPQSYYYSTYSPPASPTTSGSPKSHASPKAGVTSGAAVSPATATPGPSSTATVPSTSTPTPSASS